MGQTIVPGRVGEAVQVDVNLTQGDKNLRVPFIVVRAKSGDWLVEQIDTKALTQRQ